jgi:transcription termination/antitermination protein NusA
MTDFNGLELQEQIKAYCSEKGFSYEEVMAAISDGVAAAYRKEYGEKEKAYQAEFDADTGHYKVYEITKIVEEVLNPEREMSLTDAMLEDTTLKVGDVIKKDLGIEKEIGFGRIASQVAKQVLIYTLNNYKHSKIISKYKDFIGQVITVEVDAFKKGGYIVKLGGTNDFTTGYMSREDILPIDKFKPGQMIKALVQDITEEENKSTRIKLTRSAPEFVTAIISREVPEVESGLVKIEKIVREAGNRTKLLVSVNEDEYNEDIDPVGTILGRKNVRLLNIMREISPSIQEKVDVIKWEPENLEQMIADALEPAEIENISFFFNDMGSKVAKVDCLKTEAPMAVGRRGANVRLASALLGIEIAINTIDDDTNTHSDVTNEQTVDQPSIIVD